VIGANGRRPYIEAMNRHGQGARWRRIVAGCVIGLGLSAVGIGCGSDGAAPEPDPTPVIAFAPTVQGQRLQIAQSREFAVNVTPQGALTVAWRRGGQVVGTDPVYTYEASVVGRDTLRVHAEAGSTRRDFYWVVEVEPLASTVPPAVSQASVAHGSEPAQVVFAWSRVTGSTYPLSDYVVVLSYAGPVTAENWDAAQVLAVVPHVGSQLGYQAVFDRDHGALVPGAEAWFAIRARDDHGQMSAAPTSRRIRITTEWWIDGHVFDDAGVALEGVVVATALPARNGNSDVQGRFRLGPYRSIDTVQVQTNAEDVFFYDFTTERLVSAIDADLDLMLPRKYGIDLECTGYDGDFLTYLRSMTRTVPTPADTAASRLWKWDHYPVSVFLPDSVTTAGRDLDGLARGMMDLWNAKMGEDYLVEAETAGAADVVVQWVADIPGGAGQVSLIDPAGGVFGDVRPVRMRLQVVAGLATDQFFQEVVLHEFGHVLCLSAHSVGCESAGHLMVYGASGALSLSEPIHPDEQHAVRCVRRMGQGVDMKRYTP